MRAGSSSTKIPPCSASTSISRIRQRAFLRFNIDRAVNTQPLASSGNYLADQQQLTSAPVNGGIELLHIFSPTLVNEFKFGFNRSTARHDRHQSNGIALCVLGFRSYQL